MRTKLFNLLATSSDNGPNQPPLRKFGHKLTPVKNTRRRGGITQISTTLLFACQNSGPRTGIKNSLCIQKSPMSRVEVPPTQIPRVSLLERLKIGNRDRGVAVIRKREESAEATARGKKAFKACRKQSWA